MPFALQFDFFTKHTTEDISQLLVSENKNLKISSRRGACSSPSLCLQLPLKLFDHVLQENLSSLLFSHCSINLLFTNSSPPNPLPDPPLHFNTAIHHLKPYKAKDGPLKINKELFHFPLLPPLIRSSKANKQFGVMKHFYPYKAFNMIRCGL